MHVFECLPSPALRPYVDRSWALRTAPGELISLAELLPGTGAELLVHAGAPLRRADRSALPAYHLLCLRTTTLATAPDARGLDMFCVRFRAGALRHFLEADVREAADANAGFAELGGPPAGALGDAIAEARGFDARVALAERGLLALRARHARADLHADRAVDRIYAAHGVVRIAEIARELGIVPRYLGRRFHAAVGGRRSSSRSWCGSSRRYGRWCSAPTVTSRG